MARDPSVEGREGTPSSPAAGATFSSAIRRASPRTAWRFWRNRTRLWTVIVAGLLVVSIIAGIVYYWVERNQGEQDFVEIYITDLPANFSRVDVVLGGVYVGADNHTLVLERAAFDLLSLRGPEGALRVASGFVPRENHSEIRLVFESVRVQLNGAYIDLEVPDAALTLTHAFGIADFAGSAFLFDINLDDSILVTSTGLAFRPAVDAVYIHRYGDVGATRVDGLPTGSSEFVRREPHEFGQEKAERPGGQSVGPAEGKLAPRNPFTSPAPATSDGKFRWQSSPATSSPSPPPTTSEDPDVTPPTDTEGVLPNPGDANSLPQDPNDIGGWLVRFLPSQEDVDAMAATVESAGGQLIFKFASEPAAYIFATPEQARALSERADVAYVEADQAIVLNLQSSLPAIRLPEVQNPLLGPRDASGAPLDGRGVGVAIIDIGFDGTHPDLRHRLVGPDPVFLVNYKVESLFTVDLATTDQTSGHGTHVAGIVAGRGVADPTQRGIAYASGLYGFAIGEASTTLWPNIALDWLVQNHDKVDPPIRVVTNSWGSGSRHDPNALTTRLVEQLVDAGVVVVFSAGNAGGDGSMAATTSQCQIPKEGVICVAAYDDRNLGTRDGGIAPYSSRGALSEPATWPDLSAPGSSIRSTVPLFGAVTGLNISPYDVLSGTSMAAPHVAGVAALLMQADPGLSPAAVEAMLEATAYEYADGGTYVSSPDARYAGSHYAKGHGLLDSYAAIALALGN